MNRDAAIQRLEDRSALWDLLVIGGGATGLGCAVDAASRGLRTVLVEQHDFAKGASSRSTKLIHGGVRYLRQGRIALVRQALQERWLLSRNAPELVTPLGFAIPCYRRRDAWWYGAGLKLYDWLAGFRSLGRSRVLSRQEVLRLLPTLNSHRLRCGVHYFDAQFDDARLAVALARTAVGLGATLINYCPADRLLKHHSKLVGAAVRDAETQKSYEIRARVVLNATGAFVDQVRRLDDPQAAPLLSVSQGAHVVLDRSFLPGETALMVPKTDDGRVLFAIPWLDRLVVGTTDVPRWQPELEPRPLTEEIDFLLSHASGYLARRVQRQDIQSAFAGLRPLIGRRPQGDAGQPPRHTKALSREHAVLVADSGLLSITGGKWTTYRAMSAQAIDLVQRLGPWDRSPCVTADLALSNSDTHTYLPLTISSSDAEHAVRHEMARTLEDLLARRSRLLFLDARTAIAVAPQAAQWMAAALGRNADWQAQQVAAFRQLAAGYLPD